MEYINFRELENVCDKLAEKGKYKEAFDVLEKGVTTLSIEEQDKYEGTIMCRKEFTFIKGKCMMNFLIF